MEKTVEMKYEKGWLKSQTDTVHSHTHTHTHTHTRAHTRVHGILTHGAPTITQRLNRSIKTTPQTRDSQSLSSALAPATQTHRRDAALPAAQHVNTA